MKKFYDTHAHINMGELIKNADQICEDLKGTALINCVAVDRPTILKSIELAKKHENVRAVVGFHPCDAKEMNIEQDIRFLDLQVETNRKNIVAIGETGFDFYHKGFDIEKQNISFIEHCKLAKKYNVPIVIHVREAHEHALKMIKTHALDLRKVIHCFSPDSFETAKKYIDMGCWFSFAGVITYKKAEGLNEIIKKIPIDRVMVETDCPWLTPSPHKGKTNLPSFVTCNIEKLANLFSVSLDTAYDTFLLNSLNFFDTKM